METIAFSCGLAGWQTAARSALIRGVPPAAVEWRPGEDVQGGLELNGEAKPVQPGGAAAGAGSPAAPQTRFRVPKAFIELTKLVACHRERDKWDLLYRVLWRLTHGEPHLLEVATDPDVGRLHEREKAIRRDVHKMRAFVRFREVAMADGPWFVAWFEPHHLIVELNAPFFVERFAIMRWSILTPDACAHWDGQAVTFTAGVTRDQAPTADGAEDLWRTYYRNIFNPARVKVAAMKKEMAPYYWRNLPEAGLIPELLAEAPARVERMVAASRGKAPEPEVYGPAPVPDTDDRSLVHEAAKTCRACPLWKNATHVVFGEGPARAKVVMVGEQPGDQEDLAGQPFVGPAGKLLDRALAAAGVDRAKVYVTNAVKHFKWIPQGKRRLHQKPNAREERACRPWLEKEIELIRPKLIVCLGATAAHAVIGPGVKVTVARGEELATPFGVPALVTVHPSSLLRQPDRSRAEEDFTAFVADLRLINRHA